MVVPKSQRNLYLLCRRAAERARADGGGIRDAYGDKYWTVEKTIGKAILFLLWFSLFLVYCEWGGEHGWSFPHSAGRATRGLFAAFEGGTVVLMVTTALLAVPCLMLLLPGWTGLHQEEEEDGGGKCRRWMRRVSFHLLSPSPFASLCLALRGLFLIEAMLAVAVSAVFLLSQAVSAINYWSLREVEVYVMLSSMVFYGSFAVNCYFKNNALWEVMSAVLPPQQRQDEDEDEEDCETRPRTRRRRRSDISFCPPPSPPPPYSIASSLPPPETPEPERASSQVPVQDDLILLSHCLDATPPIPPAQTTEQQQQQQQPPAYQMEEIPL